jgi:hypothetical protein
MADATVPKNISDIGSEDAFSAWLLSDIGSLHVLFCFTEWHEPSMPGGAMDVVFTALAERYPGVEFAKVICACWECLRAAKSAHPAKARASHRPRLHAPYPVHAQANVDDLSELAEHLELAVVPSFFFFKVRCADSVSLARSLTVCLRSLSGAAMMPASSFAEQGAGG